MNNLLFHDPDLLDILIQEFFHVRKIEKNHPTLPGLALGIGLSSTRDLVSVMDQWEEGDSSYPDRSLRYLASAITRIEDHFLCQGLDSKIPAALAKFALGAYHSIKEPGKGSEQQNNAIQIIFEADQRPEQITAKSVDALKGINGDDTPTLIEMKV